MTIAGYDVHRRGAVHVLAVAIVVAAFLALVQVPQLSVIGPSTHLDRPAPSPAPSSAPQRPVGRSAHLDQSAPSPARQSIPIPAIAGARR